MPTIASRELRNHTASVLDGVTRGETYTVTVHGRPVAEIRRVESRRRPAIPKADIVSLLDRQQPDPMLVRDLAWITEGTTDDLDDLD
ncbi:type II toxin-antitoxin system Phd/YefM family antitoxin [Knoellia koreensis]|uniref:Type II toxin-antitoxin system prevent-host-death family antitoxin n=1 Tax=Knoellia koreensis TaxID=2730921 RepID=A0A849HJI7_9MICO|nr:type II toxin-antitoxin system prevent-host-death family antitoxin [Knoellia sp. DB2414S]NNM48115.1 type II toxin-antitoxin system prevent-host-death family antitoxin [Knoellia sp. DB2414S]